MKLPRILALIVLVTFIILVVLPIIYMVTTPFWVGGARQPGGYGAFFDSRHLILGRNSLGLAGGVTLLSLVIGVTLAFLIDRTDLLARRLLGVIYVVPLLIPPYIHAIVWSHLNPLVKRFLAMDIHSLGGAVFVLTLAYFPFVTLTSLSGLKSVDRNLEEASLLAHGSWRTLRRITLPLAFPHIMAGAAFVFIFSLVDFAIPDILRVKVYPVEIFVQYAAFFNEAGAMALSTPLIAITFLLIASMQWHMKHRSYVQVSGGFSPSMRHPLGGWGLAAMGFCLLVLGLSVGLPLAILAKTAGHLSNYIRVLRTSGDELFYSLSLALSGAGSALLLSFCLSYLIERQNSRWRAGLEAAVLLPLAIPATTLGIGLIKVWNRPVADIVYGSSAIILVGYVAHFIPFSFIAVSSGIKQVDPHLEEAAFLACSRWTRVVGRILVPLMRPSLVAGFFIVFVLSFGELGTTLLIIPPGRETIPVKIYNLMHYGAKPMVAALCLIVIAIILAFSGSFLMVHKRIMRAIG